MNKNLATLIDAGQSAHADGNGETALEYYQQAFAIAPRNPRLNYLIGSLLLSRGDSERALPFFQSTLSQEPENTAAQLQWARALTHNQQYPAATNAYKKLLKNNRKLVLAWIGLAQCHRAQDQLSEAKRCYKTAIKHDGYATEAMRELAYCYLDPNGEDIEKAHRYLAKADQLKPCYESKLALLRVASRWHNRKRVEQVVKQALHYASSQLAHLQRLDQQLQALSISACRHRVLFELSACWFREGDIDAAIDALQQALELRPGFLDARIQLAALLSEIGEFEAARRHFSKAEAAPAGTTDQRLELHYRHAICLKQLGQLDTARRALNSALELDPNDCRSLYGLAVIAELTGDPSQALQHLDHALGIDPGNAECLFEKSLVLLSLGRFKEAWPLYPNRIAAEHHRQYLPHPFAPDQTLPQPVVTRGADATGRFARGHRLCALMEQGLGDQLFFLRFAAPLKASGVEIHALVDSRLRDICERSGHFAAVYCPERFSRAAFESCDSALSVADLPLISGHGDSGSTPPPLPLKPSNDARRRIAEKLGHLPRPLVGLSWEAGRRRLPGEASTLHKYVPLRDLRATMRGHSGSLIVLQREPAAEDLALLKRALGERVVDMSELNQDLEAMLALLAQLDHYIGVSNTNLHLYAGLGKPASVLVPFASDWRWLGEGRHSPWFPTFDIYRQTSEGSWKPALGELESALGAKLKLR